MMSYDFQTTTHGKWILAGEHAVLRGEGALVFPIYEKKFTLSYKKAPGQLNATYEGACSPDMQLLFWSVLEHGQQLLGRSLTNVSGHFHLYSDIPLGEGMGASAALCVAMARWFDAQDLLKNQSVYSFAKELENLFHGKSSGLDISGVSATTGVYFQQGETSPITLAWQPQWFLSSCGQIGMTSHCINQVKQIWQNDANYAASIDAQMTASVIKARKSLETVHPEALNELRQAIELGAECFKQWGLVSETLERHMRSLLNLGALAVKPTGSGGGGYVLSLWDKTPPLSSEIELLKA